MSVTHRVNVNFSEGAYRDLKTISENTGKSMAEVLRDAIALELFFHEARRDGDRILIERRDGTLREVIPR